MSNLFENGSKVCVLFKVESKNDGGLTEAVRSGISSVVAVPAVGSTGGITVSGSESSGLYGSSGKMQSIKFPVGFNNIYENSVN